MQIRNAQLAIELPAEPIARGGEGPVYKAEWEGVPVAVKLMEKVGATRAYHDLARRGAFVALAEADDTRAALITRWEQAAPIVRRREGAIADDDAWLVYDSDTRKLYTEWLIVMLSRDKRLMLLLALVREVERLHRDGLVHGDLGPGNVLVGKGLSVRLIDVGMPGRGATGWMSPWHACDPLPPEADCYVLGLWVRRLLRHSRLGVKIMRNPEGWPCTRIIEALEHARIRPVLSLERAKTAFGIVAGTVVALALWRWLA